MVEKVPWLLKWNVFYMYLIGGRTMVTPQWCCFIWCFCKLYVFLSEMMEKICLLFLGTVTTGPSEQKNVLKIVSFVSKSFQHTVWSGEDSDHIQRCQNSIYSYSVYDEKKCKSAPQKPNVSCTFLVHIKADIYVYVYGSHLQSISL